MQALGVPAFLSHSKPLGSGPAEPLVQTTLAFKADAPTDELVLPVREAPPRVVIVTGRWHPHLVETYAARITASLAELEPLTVVERVFSVGVGEIPLTVQRLLMEAGTTPATPAISAVICIGVLIKGDTLHMEMIATAASVALAQLQINTGVPVLNGIIAAFAPEDAVARTTGDKCTAAYLARTALHLAL